ncbi:MAG TPA: protease inhibitor I9 family protein, partial [Acidimicrobiia bacterium]|nr:protease inhibitor I9 family protein [Acidimicrobiia bacterium]
MSRLRGMALVGAVLLGSGIPSVAQAGGASRQTYIVSLRPPAGDSGLFGARQAKLLDLKILNTYRYALSGFAASMTPAAEAVLAANPLVDSIQPDRVFRAEAQRIPTGVERVHA